MSLPTNTYNILIADDHPILAQGLANALGHFDFVNQVLTAENGKVALEKIQNENIDLLICDLRMPEMDGFEVLQALEENTILKKLIYSGDYFVSDIVKGFKYGMHGYLTKASSLIEIERAITNVIDGGEYYCEKVLPLIVLAQKKLQTSKVAILSSREKEVLAFLCQQYTNDEVSNKLGISTFTVKSHRRALLEKTGSINLAGLVLYAVENGIYDYLKNRETDFVRNRFL